MSAKSAKANRKELSLLHFPSRQYTCVNEAAVRPERYNANGDVIQKAKVFPRREYKVEVDHYRRIRRLAKSLKTSINNAVGLYSVRNGLTTLDNKRKELTESNRQRAIKQAAFA